MGTPAFRLWKIATHRVMGFSAALQPMIQLENEDPELPAEVRWAFKLRTGPVFGDFEVCPVEPGKEGAVQAACIESAKNLVADK